MRIDLSSAVSTPRFNTSVFVPVNTFVFGKGDGIHDVKTIAERLKYARGLRKLSQTQLAERVGVKQSAVGNIEAGVREGLGTLPQLAEALGIRLKWLRDHTGPMEETATVLTPQQRALLDDIEILKPNIRDKALAFIAKGKAISLAERELEDADIDSMPSVLPTADVAASKQIPTPGPAAKKTEHEKAVETFNQGIKNVQERKSPETPKSKPRPSSEKKHARGPVGP
jgi:transcriptional regulator with XRE-family HTH domain